jgi:hypothetical protein
MRARTGLALLALAATMAVALPAAAACWWYVGKTADGALLYLDGDLVIRDADTYVVLHGRTVFPGQRTDSAAGTSFKAFVGCSYDDAHYYRRHWVDASGQELRQDAFERFAPEEAALAKSFACTDPASWAGRGFELVRDPAADAPRRGQ